MSSTYTDSSVASSNSSRAMLARTTGPDPRCPTHWQPPEGLAPEQVRAVIVAAGCESDRLLRVLWATAARISEAFALRTMDVQRDSLECCRPKEPQPGW
jgi:hypothetical protein